MTNIPIKKIVFIEPKAPGNHVYTKWGLPRLGTLQLGAILKKLVLKSPSSSRISTASTGTKFLKRM